MAARGSHAPPPLAARPRAATRKNPTAGGLNRLLPLFLPLLAVRTTVTYNHRKNAQQLILFCFLLLRSALSSSSSVGFSSAPSLLCYGRELLSYRSGGGRLRSSGREARRGGCQISVEAVEDGAATSDTEDHGSVGVEAGSARRRFWVGFGCEQLVSVGAETVASEEAPLKEDRLRGKQRWEEELQLGRPGGVLAGAKTKKELH